MSFIDKIFGKEDEVYDFLDVFISDKAKELHVKELYFEHGIDLISKTIAKSEVQVFRNIKGNIEETTDEIHYLLNVRPNPNEDGTAFKKRMVTKLIREGEALVIRLQNNLYIADRWERDETVIYGKKYQNIVLSDTDGNEYELNKVIEADDAIYLSIGDFAVTKQLDNFYKDYANMLKVASKSYRSSNTKKWRLTPPGQQAGLIDPNTKKPISYDDYKKMVTDGLMDDDESIVMISEQFGLENLNEDSGKGSNSEDYRELLRQMGDTVAMSMNIPLDVFYGTSTEKSTGANDFITFAVLPYLKVIEDGFNAKLMTKESYLSGERFRFDKFTMKHFDIMDVSGSLDKLTAIGYSFNQRQKMLGLPKINEDWANSHYITKNYMDVNDSDMKGGD